MGWKNLIFEFETVVKIFVISIESCKYFIFPYFLFVFVITAEIRAQAQTYKSHFTKFGKLQQQFVVVYETFQLQLCHIRENYCVGEKEKFASPTIKK